MPVFNNLFKSFFSARSAAKAGPCISSVCLILYYFWTITSNETNKNCSTVFSSLFKAQVKSMHVTHRLLANGHKHDLPALFRSAYACLSLIFSPLTAAKNSTHNTHKRYEYHKTNVGIDSAAKASPI